ncbi:MAG: phosphate uptake regulator PhoU [Candidatus Thorarchaeota archaeon]|nr:phosphate uptake regulator PhoU [Candidatus Thorarchaeota archaeon]
MTEESLVITTRKLNQVRNSFYVYLPRNWCDRFKLSKDSEVKIEQSADGILKIIPPQFVTQGPQRAKFIIDEENKESIVNLLIGSYIVGTGEIELEFGSDLDISTREEVSQWVRRLPGFEILDEHSQSIIISDTSEKQGVFPILRRQFSTAKYMLTSLVDTMKTGKHKEAERIIDRDEDVDRHRYFVERLCHLSLQNPAYARRIQIAPPDALHFSLATKYVERIADHICEAILQLLRLEKINAKLVKTAEKLVEVYIETTSIFFRIERSKGIDKRNTAEEAKKAFTCHQHTKDVSEELDRIGGSYEKSASSETLLALHLGRISSYCEDIAEVAMNRIIEFGFNQ